MSQRAAPGSGGIEHLEAQAARLSHLAGEIRRDLDTWREHLPAASIAEVVRRIDRHLAEARKFEAIAMQSRRPTDRMLPAHFVEAGDDLGCRVGG